MNHAINLLCLTGFFILPVVLLGLRAFRPYRMRWWLLLLLTAAGSWLLVNGALHFYYARLDDLLRACGENPPEALLRKRAADGGKLVFALLFGWAYGLVYLMPWLLLYGSGHLCRRLYRTLRPVNGHSAE